MSTIFLYSTIPFKIVPLYLYLNFVFSSKPDIKNHTKLKITDTVNSATPQLVKYKFQRLFVEDKLWGQIPNFDNWVTEFMILDRYWRGNE